MLATVPPVTIDRFDDEERAMEKFAEVLMRLALEAAREGIEHGQSPFGCAIRLADGQIVSKHNTVLLSNDITAHAEINAIRESNRRQGRIHLENSIVATTCEPCPMCMAALHWARAGEVYFGATIADAAEAGFNEMDLPSHTVVSSGGNKVRLTAGVLSEECRQLFAQWSSRPNPIAY